MSQLFLSLLATSPHSPYKNVNAIFSRREYQSNSGNLGHAHIILVIQWDALTNEERLFIENLAKGLIIEVLRSDDIESYLEQRIINNKNEVHERVEDAALF